jgi:hypothetical protein
MFFRAFDPSPRQWRSWFSFSQFMNLSRKFKWVMSPRCFPAMYYVPGMNGEVSLFKQNAEVPAMAIDLGFLACLPSYLCLHRLLVSSHSSVCIYRVAV